MATIWAQEWLESERGVGVRADGMSLHLTRDDRDYFVRWYHLKLNLDQHTPARYSYAYGNARPLEVTDDFAANLFVSSIDAEARGVFITDVEYAALRSNRKFA